MLKPSHTNPVSATLAGLAQRIPGVRSLLGTSLGSQPTELAALTRRMREILDDPEARQSLAPSFRGESLVTGATSGLGQAVATQLADAGASLWLPTRGGRTPASLHQSAQVFPVDFADLTTLPSVVDWLEPRSLDLVVLNAGVMTRESRPTKQGLESMFGVNYLATFAFLRQLLASERLRPGKQTRVVLVSSEAHRSAAPVDLSRLGAWVDFGMAHGMRQYAHSKLLICTFAAELARRLDPSAVSIWAVCPGPVNSRIAREAPAAVRPLLDLVMRLGFRSPEAAALPLVALGTHPTFAGETGRYFHVEECKPMSERALDPEAGRGLWDATESLLRRLDAAVEPPAAIYLRP